MRNVKRAPDKLTVMEVDKHRDIEVMKMIKAQAAAQEKEINPALMLSEEGR